MGIKDLRLGIYQIIYTILSCRLMDSTVSKYGLLSADWKLLKSYSARWVVLCPIP
jgi:hypothetical protein